MSTANSRIDNRSFKGLAQPLGMAAVSVEPALCKPGGAAALRLPACRRQQQERLPPWQRSLLGFLGAGPTRADAPSLTLRHEAVLTAPAAEAAGEHPQAGEEDSCLMVNRKGIWRRLQRCSVARSNAEQASRGTSTWHAPPTSYTAGYVCQWKQRAANQRAATLTISSKHASACLSARSVPLWAGLPLASALPWVSAAAQSLHGGRSSGAYLGDGQLALPGRRWHRGASSSPIDSMTMQDPAAHLTAARCCPPLRLVQCCPLGRLQPHTQQLTHSTGQETCSRRHSTTPPAQTGRHRWRQIALGQVIGCCTARS